MRALLAQDNAFFFLPGQVATAEILLERNQNPNRSGKSLASRALGSNFSLRLFWALLFLLMAHFLMSALSLTKDLCFKMSTLGAKQRSKRPNNLYNLPTATYTFHPIILTVCLWAALKEALRNPFVAVKYGGHTSKTWCLGRQEEQKLKVILSYIVSWTLTWVLERGPVLKSQK